jgi:hypothetical protein
VSLLRVSGGVEGAAIVCAGETAMIRNWNDFDERLKQVALIDIAVTEAGRARDLRLIAAETKYKDATAEVVAARGQIMGDLEKFYRANRKEVEAGGKKSKDLNFGAAGIRATAASLRLRKGVKWPAVVAAIKAAYTSWERFVAVTEKVKKEELKRLPDTELAELGLSAKGGEEFWVETYPEKAAAAA